MVLAPLMWIAVASRAWRWWWSRSWVLGSMVVALGVVAVHLSLNIPAVETLVQTVVPIPNFSTGLRMVLFNLMAASSGVLALAVTSDPEKVARGARVLGLIAVVGSVVAMAIFVCAPTVPQAADGFEFDISFSHLPGYAEAGIAGALFPALLCPALMVMTSRAADVRSLTGWSLTLLSVGLASATAWAWIRLSYFVAVRYLSAPQLPVVFEVTRAVSAVGVLVIFVGMMLSPVVSRVRAQRILWAIGPLHRELVSRWPGVRRPSRRGSSTEERASDRVTELLDALSMEAQRAAQPNVYVAHSSEVAAAASDWLLHARPSPAFNSAGIRSAALEAELDRRWALTLARKYRDGQREVSA
ncbi:hypothetical protein BOX37_28070 [Nocardia mangyaensis]|uniref:Uncharacterized protein n=1 Tax=Nocardia mangyaensis TaxID=2213200 RepID=A0A1J0VYK4_9NOCA|nr:hypothetical protein BOX37_28070 [Nocardia mangyaensis]